MVVDKLLIFILINRSINFKFQSNNNLFNTNCDGRIYIFVQFIIIIIIKNYSDILTDYALIFIIVERVSFTNENRLNIYLIRLSFYFVLELIQNGKNYN